MGLLVVVVARMVPVAVLLCLLVPLLVQFGVVVALVVVAIVLFLGRLRRRQRWR